MSDPQVAVGFFELLAGAGGPSAIALAAFWLLTRRDYRELREDVQEIKKSQAKCQDERKAEEAALRNEMTAQGTSLAEHIAYSKGRENGTAQKCASG